MRSLSPKYVKFTALLALGMIGFLGRIDTAQAQAQDNLLVSQSSYTFSSPIGGGFQSQAIQVTASAAPLNFVLSYQSAANWFIATTNSNVTPAQVTVSVNPGQLGVGTYAGTITLTPSGASTTPVVISLTLMIAAPNAIAVSPTTLNFTAAAGTTTVTQPQVISITSATNNIGFTAAITYGQQNVTNWLQVLPTSAVTNATMSVTANPTGLAGGNYTAAITLSTTTGSAQVVNVSFAVTAQPTLSANLTTIPFFYQIGQSQSAFSSTFLNISSGAAVPVPITLGITTSNCPGFLGVSQSGPLTIPAGAPASVQVYATGLASFTLPQTCSGAVVITSTVTTNASLTIPVTLTVGNNPLLIITPASASFMYQVGAATPANQNVTISSTTSGLQFTASSNQPWLTVTSSGVTSTSSQISLGLVASQLAALIPNTYQAIVTVNAPGAANSPLTIPVTLTVGANTALTFSPPFANFVYEMGLSQPNTQSISIGTTGGQIPFSITVPSSTGGQFVTVNPTSGVAPTTITVSAAPGTLPAGTYSNAISVTPTSPGQSQTAQSIPVQLTISNPGIPQLNASPQVLNFTYGQGQSISTITAQTIALTSTDPNAAMQISNVTVNSSWLTTSYAVGSVLMTPQSLQVIVIPTFLVPSPVPYTANLTISATNPQGQTSTTTIQVSLNYTSGVTLTSSPASLTFAQIANGGLPPTQSLSIGASGITGATLPFSATVSTVNGVNWLSVTPSSGNAPASITVGATSSAASLSPGTYAGSVIIYGMGAANANGTLTIPVTLTVTAAPTLTATPVSVTFTGTVAGANPAPSTLQVAASNATGPVSFTVAATTATGGNWLTATPATATTPSAVTVSANIAGLAPGAYNGTVTLTPAGGGSTTSIPVTLTVAAQAVPGLTSVINAASGATGTIAPGEIVSIFGSNLGPISPAGLTLNAQGNVTTTLAGVTVTFNGIQAPLTYASATQINCVVPFELSNATSAQIIVSFNGVVSQALTTTVSATLPGIFTQNASGNGLGAILKPDYSVVTALNPAPRGSTIIIYATGGGLTTPSSITGAVAPQSTLLNTNAKVTVTIGGISATVNYAGSAPGLVEGVLQINAVVPNTIVAANQPIIVTVGNASSQNGVTVAVQ